MTDEQLPASRHVVDAIGRSATMHSFMLVALLKRLRGKGLLDLADLGDLREQALALARILTESTRTPEQVGGDRIMREVEALFEEALR